MTKYNGDITRDMAGHLEGGMGRVDTCALVGISYETFTQWMLKAEFYEAVKKAEMVCKSRNIAIVQRATNTSWQAAAWWLERKYPKEFALQRDEAPRNPDEIPQRMAERAQELLKRLEEKRGASVPAGATTGTH